MAGEKLSRRHLLQGSGALAAGSLARLSLPGIAALSEAALAASSDNSAFEVLFAAEAREFEAIASRILPTTDTPGAREAGVIYFMDKAFASFEHSELEDARSGLQRFQASIKSRFPGAGLFSDLEESDQDAYLKTQEDSAFFGKMRFLTIAGFLGMSSHGGNRDDVGWQLIGFDGHHGAWQPPFGYYDAEYLKEQQDAE
jgi:gluconate 2-dehydrogenase gamma chain